VNRISRHAPELNTVLAISDAVQAIDVRRARISLSPLPATRSIGAEAEYPRLMVNSSGNDVISHTTDGGMVR